MQGASGGCSMLTHPLEPLVPLQAQDGGSSEQRPMQGECIVWSSREVPYIATHNQVGLYPAPSWVAYYCSGRGEAGSPKSLPQRAALLAQPGRLDCFIATVHGEQPSLVVLNSCITTSA